jgi:hypothetical protein
MRTSYIYKRELDSSAVAKVDGTNFENVEDAILWINNLRPEPPAEKIEKLFYIHDSRFAILLPANTEGCVQLVCLRNTLRAIYQAVDIAHAILQKYEGCFVDLSRVSVTSDKEIFIGKITAPLEKWTDGFLPPHCL